MATIHNAYIDSSVLLRIILDEKGALPKLDLYKNLYSSWLLRLESHRILQRLLKSNKLTEQSYLERITLLSTTLKTISLVEISKPILNRAEETFPLHIGTLDAIHLATALALREHQIETKFLTHDEQLGKNARAIAFEVVGILV